MEVFADYLAKIDDPPQRDQTEEVLNWVQRTFPGLVPKIAWNQPMFTDHETFIIGFSVAKKHLAVAPEKAGVAKFADEIVKAGYEHTDQMIRMRWDRPVDYGLLERIIAFNIEDKAECGTFWRK
ncbi:iron chaperone [Saccharibacillus sp. CPCC 101409]|uniref:iron chaperone n=1 Tax=Saccharibacillus sp. CPCC 101409 TaxID=3058041 RepID=UPI0026730AE5|nr:iron chaperone [Saccharibacillus sp. CPCC 101409]MDO3411713.1 iron chaperone [Saccharibacillus sp. CPCC 101409]